MTEPIPYVGVSGVVDPAQQWWLREPARLIKEKNRLLLLGVKAMHKTHWLEVPNKYGPDHSPIGEDIPKSLGALEPGEFGVAQVFLDIEEAEQEGIKDYERRFIEKLLARQASWLSGIQFDILPWHERDYHGLFTRIKDTNRSVLLQCFGDIMNTNTPQEVVEKLKAYQGLVDYVLFDASHGQGKTLQAEQLKPFIEAASNIEGLGVGIAGGLDGNVVAKMLPDLLKDYPKLSFDAEGKLRDPVAKQYRLDPLKTAAYLKVAGQVIPPVK